MNMNRNDQSPLKDSLIRRVRSTYSLPTMIARRGRVVTHVEIEQKLVVDALPPTPRLLFSDSTASSCASSLNSNIPQTISLKLLWDTLTVLVSFYHAYLTHAAIRDRQFNNSALQLCELWFVLDMCLNFCGVGRRRMAYYLTSWFVVDILALVPGEALYIQPIIELQNRRPLFIKYIFRTKGVIRVTRWLRKHHFQLFGQIARQTKQVGYGSNRLLRMMIKYIPKYLLFLNNMKAMIAIRLLRMVHFLHRVHWNYTSVKKQHWEQEWELEEYYPLY
jgi:hypothetical protein